MSKLHEYLSAKKTLAELQAQLEALENDPAFTKDLEFQKKLEDLISEFGKSDNDVLIALGLNPSEIKSKGSNGPKRSLKTYKNPHTGEVVKTRGGNHKVLNEWRKQYGKDVINSWIVAS